MSNESVFSLYRKMCPAIAIKSGTFRARPCLCDSALKLVSSIDQDSQGRFNRRVHMRGNQKVTLPIICNKFANDALVIASYRDSHRLARLSSQQESMIVWMTRRIATHEARLRRLATLR